MNYKLYLLYILLIALLCGYLLSKNTNMIMETFNPVLYIKNHTDTFYPPAKNRPPP